MQNQNHRKLLKIPNHYHAHILKQLFFHPAEAMDLLHHICDTEKPDMIIGSSMGGMYTEMLYGFDRLIEDVTGIRTRVAKNPVECVAIGTGESLEHLNAIPEGSVNFSRYR